MADDQPEDTQVILKPDSFTLQTSGKASRENPRFSTN